MTQLSSIVCKPRKNETLGNYTSIQDRVPIALIEPDYRGCPFHALALAPVGVHALQARHQIIANLEKVQQIDDWNYDDLFDALRALGFDIISCLTIDVT